MRGKHDKTGGFHPFAKGKIQRGIREISRGGRGFFPYLGLRFRAIRLYYLTSKSHLNMFHPKKYDYGILFN